jgi:uncharacterized protein (TIGR02594 family)
MTTLELAQVFEGERERAGADANPFIVWCLQSCDPGATDDEVPWCSGFVSRMAERRHRGRSRSLRARSWLREGQPTTLDEAVPGEDVVILKRGVEPQPGPDVIAAPGHVGFFAGREGDAVLIYGGNQSNKVGLARFPVTQILGIRRLLA